MPCRQLELVFVLCKIMFKMYFMCGIIERGRVMEQISLFKLIIVGVPETTLNLLIGLVLCRDNVKKDWKSFIFKMVASIIVILITIYFARREFKNVTLLAGTITLIYVIIFKIIWEMNFRQSILSGCSTMFLLCCLETITLPLYKIFLQTMKFTGLFDASILFSPFLRLLHVMIFLILTKWNFRNNEVISGKWSKQNKHSKIAIIIIILSILWCMASMLNYMDFYDRIILFDDTSFFIGNIRIFFWMTIWFFIFLLVLLYYIFNFLDTQKMFDISLEEILSTAGEELSKEEIKGYIEILQQKYNEKGGK